MKKQFSSKRDTKSKIIYSIKKPIKIVCRNLSHRLTIFKKLYIAAKLKKRKKRYEHFAKEPINQKLMIFESFMGRKYADSPKAIYEYMLNRQEYKDYNFIWFFKERVMDDYLFLEQNDRTKLILWGSPEYYEAYATAKYWFTNSRVPGSIGIRDGQNYVQCWHGTPLKRLGFDIEVDAKDARNQAETVKKVYEDDARRYTYMISPSAYCTEKFTSAFNLKAIGKSDIIVEEGYPRNDEIVNHTEADIESVKKKLGIAANKKVVLYAPTWRESQHQDGLGYVYESPIDFDKMKATLGNDYVVLFRAHYFIANQFNFDEYKDYVIDVCNYPEINDLYIVSDILITDYSSVFFDYGLLKRPIIFYMYDLKYYRDELRGFYISLDELPGPIVEKQEDLFEKIKTVNQWSQKKDMREKYEAFTNKFTYLDDGHATERVVKRIVK